MHFKNTDARWGAGEGRLSSLSVDENFYEADQRMDALEANPPDPISVETVTSDGETFSVILTDGTQFGPFTLPTATFEMLGEWQPLTPYTPNKFFSEGGFTYLINFAHTSAASFDPNANDGLGHNFYSLLPFPNNPPVAFLDAGWQPLTFMSAAQLFSIPDVGMFLSLRDHTTDSTFDADATDGGGNPLYQKVFNAIESEIAHIQFQFPGSPPADGSAILVFLQDDNRDLVLPTDFTDSIAHLATACTDTMIFSITHTGLEIGTVTFQPGELVDGEGGQYGVVAGVGDTIANSDILRVLAPLTPDATAKFFTLSLAGTYEDPS